MTRHPRSIPFQIQEAVWEGGVGLGARPSHDPPEERRRRRLSYSTFYYMTWSRRASGGAGRD